MKWGKFWNPWFPVTESKVGRATTYFTEQMSKSSQMVHHWEASKFAMDPRIQKTRMRKGPEPDVLVSPKNWAQKRAEVTPDWGQRLSGESTDWQLPNYSAAVFWLEFGEWRDIKESWRKYRYCYLYLEESFSTPCWISFFDFNLLLLLLL